MCDLRPVFFERLDWYQALRPEDGASWNVVRGPNKSWYTRSLNAALAFALDHRLYDTYRARFAGLSIKALRPAADGHSSAFAIWGVANELLGARYLERRFQWTLDLHEPPGRSRHVGDWQFVTPSGRTVFVEVKSVPDARLPPRQAASVNFTPTVRSHLARACRQLPADGRATLVLLVGGCVILDISERFPVINPLLEALFGAYQVRFNVMPYDPDTLEAGPSLYDMLVQPRKHTRLGCVAALLPGGRDYPTLRFYAIHNPFASDAALASTDLEAAFQFVVDKDGHGSFSGHLQPDVWERLRPLQHGG